MFFKRVLNLPYFHVILLELMNLFMFLFEVFHVDNLIVDWKHHL